MMRAAKHTLTVLLALTLVPLAAPTSSGAQEPGGAALLTTSHFAFYSDFETNLNDALIAASVARNFGNAELFQRGAEQACFDGLAPAARSGWNDAVDHYAEAVVPGGWMGNAQFRLRLQLAGVAGGSDAEERQLLEDAARSRAAAAPAYEACQWAEQETINRRWVDALQPLLAAHEAAVATRLEELYRIPWHGLPIRVDVVQTVNAQGANSIFLSPAGGHLLVSPRFEGDVALEIVFHEASHLLMRRNDPLQRALAEAADSLGVPEPDGLWHVVLFYTTGDTVRRVLEAAGEPGYQPFLYEIFQRSPWVRFQEALEATWPAYMDGERTPEQAATELIGAIGGN